MTASATDPLRPESASPPAPQRKPRRRVVLNLAFSIFTRAQGAVFTYLTTFLLLRSLEVEQYGLYTVLFVGTITNLTMIGRLGLPNLLSRFVPEYYSQGRFRLIAQLFRATNLLQGAFTGLMLIVVLIFAETLSTWLDFPHSANVLRIFALGALSFLMAENYRILLGGLFQHGTIFWRNLIYNIVGLGAIFWAARLPNPFMMIVIVEAALYALSLVLFAISYRHSVTPRVVADTHPDEKLPWKRFTRYTVFSYLNEIGVMLLNSATDLFLITGFLGGAAAGMYGLANRILALFYQVLPSNFLSVVITPLFFSEYGASKEKARFGFTLLVKVSLLVTLPIGFWLALMARPVIVELFDPRYADAARILVIMALFIPMETLRYPLGLMLQNAERNDLLIYSKIFGVLKILAGLWLVPSGGVMAMVWITSLAITGQNLLCYVWIVTKLESPTDLWGIARLLLNSLVATAIFYPLVPFFSSVTGVIASVPVYAILFLGLCLLNKGFRKEERAFINQHLPRPVWYF